jgi:hypothetical protein
VLLNFVARNANYFNVLSRNIHVPYCDEVTGEPKYMATFYKQQMLSRLPIDWPERWSEV